MNSNPDGSFVDRAGFLKQIPGPVLAVGHSYGGAIISNAATDADNVVGLVFVAAFAPDEGETLGEIEAGSKDSVLMSALVPLHYPKNGEPGVEFAIGSMERVPYPDASFDVVVINSVLQMLPDLAALRRSLVELACDPEPIHVLGTPSMPAKPRRVVADRQGIHVTRDRYRAGGARRPGGATRAGHVARRGQAPVGAGQPGPLPATR